MPMKDVPSIETLAAHGAHVTCTGEPQVFLDDMFYLSGEVPRVTPFERGLPAHYQKAADGNWTVGGGGATRGGAYSCRTGSSSNQADLDARP